MKQLKEDKSTKHKTSDNHEGSFKELTDKAYRLGCSVCLDESVYSREEVIEIINELLN